MALTISLVVLFGIALAALLRFKALGYGSALIAVMFGFFLASTGLAGPINNLVSGLADAVSKLNP
ncbi:hypothetical protein TR51_28925 [Kitasatospora griseola]|uniref:Uncharacterized protein n=1 Tax=Kitasatospora griseola TaxID=2064 RepID=A0A0D0PWF2_KITGR|nr:hypothetical protein [Kitasatospora griseola]KIQ62913.1 hypothetical protein TR51_28925 [Kitasatospora griseola]